MGPWQRRRKMATLCLTDAGGRRRIGGSFGRVQRVGDQKKRQAIVGREKVPFIKKITPRAPTGPETRGSRLGEEVRGEP
jgi:hypothetical protein